MALHARLRRLLASEARRVAGVLDKVVNQNDPAPPVGPDDAPADWAGDPAAPAGGPPEHWLAVVREKAPQLLQGRGIGVRSDDPVAHPLSPDRANWLAEIRRGRPASSSTPSSADAEPQEVRPLGRAAGLFDAPWPEDTDPSSAPPPSRSPWSPADGQSPVPVDGADRSRPVTAAPDLFLPGPWDEVSMPVDEERAARHAARLHEALADWPSEPDVERSTASADAFLSALEWPSDLDMDRWLAPDDGSGPLDEPPGAPASRPRRSERVRDVVDTLRLGGPIRKDGWSRRASEDGRDRVPPVPPGGRRPHHLAGAWADPWTDLSDPDRFDGLDEPDAWTFPAPVETGPSTPTLRPVGMIPSGPTVAGTPDRPALTRPTDRWAAATEDAAGPWPALPGVDGATSVAATDGPSADASSAWWPELPDDADQRALPPALDDLDTDHVRRLDDEQRGR